MSQIDITPAKTEDFIQLGRLNYHGFSATPINLLMFGNQNEEEQIAHTQQYLRKCLVDASCKLTKAVVDGQIVGFAQWHYFVEPMPVEDDLPSNWGEGATGPLCDASFGSMEKARKGTMGGRALCCPGNFSHGSRISRPRCGQAPLQ